MEIANKNKISVLLFYTAIDQMDVDALVDLFSEDCKHVNPYASGILPHGAEGKEGIRSYWTPVFEQFQEVNMTILEIYAMEDPTIVYVKAKGQVVLKDGPDYNNDYYMIFRFDSDGKIKHYSEIFNPVVALKSFNLVDQLK